MAAVVIAPQDCNFPASGLKTQQSVLSARGSPKMSGVTQHAAVQPIICDLEVKGPKLS